MKSTVKFIVMVTSLSLVIADTTGGSTTARPETVSTVTSDPATSESLETTSAVSHTISPNSAMSMKSSTEVTDTVTDDSESFATAAQSSLESSTAPLVEESENETVTDAVSTSLPNTRTTTMVMVNSENLATTTQSLLESSNAPLTEESKNETVTDAVSTSLPSATTTTMVTDVSTMKASSNSVTSMLSPRPSLTAVKGSTSGSITNTPVVITELVDSNTTVFAETTDVVEDFLTSVMELVDIQTDTVGTSTKPVTSAAYGTSPKPVTSAASGTSLKPVTSAASGTSIKPVNSDASGTSTKPVNSAASGTSTKPVTSAASGTSTKPATSPANGTSPETTTSAVNKTELVTSQIARETTLLRTENNTSSVVSPLTAILDDDRTTTLDDDITTLLEDDITTASQHPLLPRKNYLVVLTLSGNCSKVLEQKEDKDKFLKEIKNVLLKHFGFLQDNHIIMRDATCGSVLVELTVEMSEKDKTKFDLDIGDNFTFTYKAEVLQVVKSSVEDYVEGTTPPVTSDDSSSLNFQETLIFIVIGSVGGAFVLLSLFLICHYLIQKLMRAGKKSFSPTDEPCIKLSEFNMAHTYIPRPQSIYSATTRSSFLPYESMMEPRLGYSSASATPYVYADGDQIRERYQEVVDKDQPVTPTTKTVDDFGKSGIPNWDLPVLEGVVHEGASSPASVENRQIVRNSTFHAPPDENSIPPPDENSIPPPPAASPPPPPPSVRYHPQGHKGPEGNSLKSDDGSSHTEQSSGDTRRLIKGDNQDVGVDNPAMELDSVYF